MKERKQFDVRKAVVPNHTMVISKILDPYTAHVAKFFYNIGISANLMTIITFILGMSGIAVMVLIPNYTGLIIAAVLITLRNIGDTVDGKIARGSETTSPIGGFLDIFTDWIIFHAAFFVALGHITNNVTVGFLCVTGYMSREFTRTKFTHFFGTKITETNEAKKIPFVVYLARRYDIGTAFWLIPFVMLLTDPVYILYFISIIEYSLLFGEFCFDLLLFIKNKNINSF